MISIIPKPAEIELTGGELQLGCELALDLSSSGPHAEQLAGLISDLFDNIIDISNTNDGDGSTLSLRLTSEADLIEGAYGLVVDSAGIHIESSTYAGFVHGLQSLKQLLSDPTQADDLRLPQMHVTDHPRFPWRGMHLDVSRHFFDIDFIKKYLDLLALHKMNIFHWHLTDDQGWRVEIERYPQLTEIGGWRSEPDGSHYGGFYTKKEIREIVAYAQARAITIVPEIDLPGHTRAVLAPYPQFSCTGQSLEVPSTWGIFDDVLCLGKDEVFEFTENVLSEIMALFPGEYIHIGGDECPTVRWENCPHCAARMKKETLSSVRDLQPYFIDRIRRLIEANGRKVIGWDEILDASLSPSVAVMTWRNSNYGIDAARRGHPVVMSPVSHCYFDFYQAETNEPKAIGGLIPLEKVYQFEPLPETLSGDATLRVSGGQGNVWTEYMADSRHVEYMAVPRICALAEVLWTVPEGRNWPDFLNRLRLHLGRPSLRAVNFRDPFR